MPIVEKHGGPRYTYEQPTEKPMLGAPPELGYKINDYKLPVTDVQEQRRNFDGYQVQRFYSLADIQMGDTSGTTETDSINDPSYEASEGYTNINEKSGKGSRWNTKSSSRRK